MALDGYVYFKASDMAKFLGYANCTGFARRHATKDLRKMVPHGYLNPSFGNKKYGILVFDFVEMEQVIKKSHHHIGLEISKYLVENLLNLWCYGSVAEDYAEYCSPFPDRAFPLVVQSPGKAAHHVQEWIRKFVETVRKTFIEYYFASNVDAPPSVNLGVLSPPPSVNVDVLSPPPSVNVDAFSPPPSVNQPAMSDPMIKTEPDVEIRDVFKMDFGQFKFVPDEIYINACGENHVYVKQ